MARQRKSDVAACDALECVSPYVRVVGEWRGAGHDKRLRSLYDHLIEYIKHGRGEYVVEGTSYRVSRGDLVFIPPRVPFSVSADPGDPYTRQCVHFDLVPDFGGGPLPLWEYHPKPLREDYVRETPEVLKLLRPPVVSSMLDEPRLPCLLTQLLREMCNKRPGYELACKACMLDILLMVHRCRSSAMESRTRRPSLVLPQRLEECREYAEAHLCEQIRLSDLARAAHCHPVHLERLYRQYLGCSPIQYVLETRIEHAKQLLEASELNITEVANHVGFESAQYFATVFKSRAGMSPSTYRKMAALGVDAIGASHAEHMREYAGNRSFVHSGRPARIPDTT